MTYCTVNIVTQSSHIQIYSDFNQNYISFLISSNTLHGPTKLYNLCKSQAYWMNQNPTNLFKFYHSWITILDYALLIFHVNDNNLYGADSCCNRSNFSYISYNFYKWSQILIYEKFYQPIIQLWLFQLKDRLILKSQNWKGSTFKNDEGKTFVV